MARNVAILLFDDVEVLDFAGPFEIFAVTGLRDEGDPPFNVYTVAATPGPVAARNNLVVTPTFTLEDCPPPDLVVIPGGYGSRAAMRDPVIVDWVRQQHESTELTLSVCTGALVLATAGLLEDLEATTHHGAFDLLAQVAPATTVVRGVRLVDTGRIVTSAGVQAGMDMALHVVGRLLGEDVAKETASYIEYDWDPSRTG